MRKRVTIGFGFTCDWLRNWREFFKAWFPYDRRRSQNRRNLLNRVIATIEERTVSVKTLEAWQSKLTPKADNNSCPLPGRDNILFNKYS